MAVLPFNFNPADTLTDTSSYTVPGDTYAYAVVTLNVRATADFNVPLADNIVFGSESTTVHLWLDTGDILTKSEIPASGSVGPTSAAKQITGTSVAELRLNVGSGAVKVALVECSCHASTTSATSSTVTAEGTAEVNWVITEYSIV